MCISNKKKEFICAIFGKPFMLTYLCGRDHDQLRALTSLALSIGDIILHRDYHHQNHLFIIIIIVLL